jgi:hypothetical protein
MQPDRAEDQYSIVVTGNMNPSIHHPSWYELRKILDEQDLKSIDKGTQISTPVVAQFKNASFSVACDNRRWMIETLERASFDKILRVASLTFEMLPETPVDAYGINFSFHRDVPLTDTSSFLASLVGKLPLGLITEPSTKLSAKIFFQRSLEDVEYNINLEPSPKGADMIFIGLNSHHPIKRLPHYQDFNLTPLLVASAAKDRLVADEQLKIVLETLNQPISRS